MKKEKEVVKEIFNLLQSIGASELTDRAYANVSRAKIRCATILYPETDFTENSWDEISIIINGKNKP